MKSKTFFALSILMLSSVAFANCESEIVKHFQTEQRAWLDYAHEDEPQSDLNLAANNDDDLFKVIVADQADARKFDLLKLRKFLRSRDVPRDYAIASSAHGSPYRFDRDSPNPFENARFSKAEAEIEVILFRQNAESVGGEAVAVHLPTFNSFEHNIPVVDANSLPTATMPPTLEAKSIGELLKTGLYLGLATTDKTPRVGIALKHPIFGEAEVNLGSEYMRIRIADEKTLSGIFRVRDFVPMSAAELATECPVGLQSGKFFGFRHLSVDGPIFVLGKIRGPLKYSINLIYGPKGDRSFATLFSPFASQLGIPKMFQRGNEWHATGLRVNDFVVTRKLPK